MACAEDASGIRRSERAIKLKRSYSPEPVNQNKKSGKNVGTKKIQKSQKTGQDVERHPSGSPFFCDRCKAPFILNPLRKMTKKSRHTSFPRHRVDPVSNRALTLCNACGISLACQRKAKREKIVPTVFEKEKYLQEAQTFASSLVEVLQDPEAKRLFCPEFKANTPCACLQKFVLSNGNLEDSQKRAMLLLQLLKEAKRLSRQKCYSLEQLGNTMQVCGRKGHKSRNIGLGNGQKRSQEFESFVLEQRRYLRDELRLCERATQRVLMYSNNFLHKKLKTEPQRGSRVQRKKGKSAMGLLKPVAEMATETCCIDNCVLMALTHSALLHQWRERAALGQAEARRVLAEMLTPCGGGRTNCYKFISTVTGCSHSTISKVNEQMKRTGGEREPPEHGLKKWWQEQSRHLVPNQTDRDYTDPDSPVGSDLDAVCNIPLSTEGDDSLVSDANLDPPLRPKDHMSESHSMELQQESLLDDPMFPLNSNSQVVLKLNGNVPRLCNVLRLRKNLPTYDSDEILLGADGSELSANLFLSLLSNDNCQQDDTSCGNTNRQAISHLVLDDVTTEHLLSSGLVINVVQPSKVSVSHAANEVPVPFTTGRHPLAIDDGGCPLIGDVSLLRSHTDGSSNSSNGSTFLNPVTSYTHKESTKRNPQPHL